jgi:outer membrane protein TolC
VVAEDPFAGAVELTLGAVVEAVLARNPTIAEMVAAWQAAAARYPQVTSLEDPRLGGFVGPGSIGSKDVDFAYRLEASQAFPYPGKRELRGRGALHEAASAGAEVEDTRVQLAEATRSAFAEYFRATRAGAIGEENLKLLDQFRENALARFKANQTSQQDALQAEVAIARQRERLLTLERERNVARARLNTLMHLPPGHPLPPPPAQLEALPVLSPVAEMLAQAANRRPDVQALRHRIAADEAAVELAFREYKPDFELMAAYDAWWQPRERDLRTMIGVRANLPVRYARRGGAVSEAQSRLAQRWAELARLVARVNFEVQEAYEQVAESERLLALYEGTTLPTARRNVELATSEYAVGRVPFLNLIEAQRNLIELRERYLEVSAELLRRRATLERMTGGIGPTATTPNAAPASSGHGGPSTPSPDSTGTGR